MDLFSLSVKRKKILSPHEEMSLRPLHSILACSTCITEPLRDSTVGLVAIAIFILQA